MAATLPSEVQRFLDYLAENALPEAVLAYQLTEAEIERATDLAERNAENALSSVERIELEQIMHFDRIVTVLKAKALAEMEQR